MYSVWLCESLGGGVGLTQGVVGLLQLPGQALHLILGVGQGLAGAAQLFLQGGHLVVGLLKLLSVGVDELDVLLHLVFQLLNLFLVLLDGGFALAGTGGQIAQLLPGVLIHGLGGLKFRGQFFLLAGQLFYLGAQRGQLRFGGVKGLGAYCQLVLDAARVAAQHGGQDGYAHQRYGQYDDQGLLHVLPSLTLVLMK